MRDNALAYRGDGEGATTAVSFPFDGIPAVKYSRVGGGGRPPTRRPLLAIPREAYALAGGGNNENGCILTTHTLIVNPVSVADRAGPAPAVPGGDHPLIRSFASLQPLSHLLHPNVLRASSFETCTLCQNSSPCTPPPPLPPSIAHSVSLSFALILLPHPNRVHLPLPFSLFLALSGNSPPRLWHARTRTVTSTMPIIHAISRVYTVLRNDSFINLK